MSTPMQTPMPTRPPLTKKTCGFIASRLFLCALGAVVASGCAGYHFGPSTLYNREIKTVFVPMVEADTYRHNMGERLTESVCKKITQKTPYHLAGANTADSVLTIRLTAENQTISALDAYNNTRQKNLTWSVAAVWKDRRNIALAELDPVPLSAIGVNINETEYLVAEMGQSYATASQELIDRIADRIVGLMEAKW